jgi:uncharacterized protein YbbC (DUF1343 family)
MLKLPMALTPTTSVHRGQLCSGVQIILDDWKRFQPLRTGLTIAVELRKLHPNDWQIKNYDRLLVHKATFEGVQGGKSVTELEKGWQAGLKPFQERRQKYLLYEE